MTGTIAGEAGILRTTDGGISWTRLSGGTGNFKAISFVDANTGFVGGDDGIILRTTDGGTTWTSQTSGVTGQLWGACFTDTNTGNIVGQYGALLRTTDGGENWIKQVPDDECGYPAVCFVNNDTGVVVGCGGLILRTTDGGITWVRQPSGTTENLLGAHFIDANTGNAVGWYGTILRTSTGGVTWVEEAKSSPSFFHLSQNYPNPVTTSTTIPFTLSKPEHIRLSICDVLGREVAVLVDGERMAGEQSMAFNASRLGTGIYFTVLRTGSAVETRMMLLTRHGM